MPLKFVVIAAVLLLLILLIACYTRFINIDSIIRRNDKPASSVSITVYNLDNRFEAGKVGEGLIINDNKLRFFSSLVPPVKIKVSELQAGKDFYITDSGGRRFLIGHIKSMEINDNSAFCGIALESSDKVILKSSYSVFPYYYGFYVLSPGPISRYYHYHSLSIKKATGASLLMEWKFSTYKGKDGKLVPDLFGDNKEGLVNLVIN